MNLSLVDAFGRFGAKPANRLRGNSAIASDGALVLSCSYSKFGHPSQGVLRYEGKLAKDGADAAVNDLLGQHLTLARDGDLPVRLVVMTSTEDAVKNKVSRSFHLGCKLKLPMWCTRGRWCRESLSLRLTSPSMLWARWTDGWSRSSRALTAG